MNYVTKKRSSKRNLKLELEVALKVYFYYSTFKVHTQKKNL